MCMWNWFAVSTLRVPHVTFLEMVGISWLIRHLFYQQGKDDKNWESLFLIIEVCVPDSNKEKFDQLKREIDGNAAKDIFTTCLNQ